MRAEYTFNGPILRVKFTPALDEGSENARGIEMVGTVLEIRLSSGMKAELIHKDHLALITILSVHPFVKSELYIDLEVSSDFAISTSQCVRYNVQFSGTNGEVYLPTERSKPCLAFSGGVDSTAALMLMPKNTVCAWLDRPQITERTLYNKTAAKHTMNFAQGLGYDVHKIYCDVEHLRKPVGFPVDLTSGIASVAIASQSDVDSIAFGMVMESAYRTGHAKFRDYPKSFHYKSWAPLFDSAKIPLYLPVGGISEVGTSTIVLNSEFNGESRSCIRGQWPEQCNNCWKCFRKTLVDNRILGSVTEEDSMQNWIKVREVKYKLKSWPVSHENVLAWALKGELVSGSTAKSLLARLEGSRRDLSLLEKWYPPSIDLIPEKYREEFKINVDKFLSQMTSAEIADTEGFDISDWLSSQDAADARDRFEEALS